MSRKNLKAAAMLGMAAGLMCGVQVEAHDAGTAVYLAAQCGAGCGAKPVRRTQQDAQGYYMKDPKNATDANKDQNTNQAPQNNKGQASQNSDTNKQSN